MLAHVCPIGLWRICPKISGCNREMPKSRTADSPCGSAALAGLAEEEAHLLQGLCESVLGRHVGELIRRSQARGRKRRDRELKLADSFANCRKSIGPSLSWGLH